jgi:hypothetical protein
MQSRKDLSVAIPARAAPAHSALAPCAASGRAESTCGRRSEALGSETLAARRPSSGAWVAQGWLPFPATRAMRPCLVPVRPCLLWQPPQPPVAPRGLRIAAIYVGGAGTCMVLPTVQAYCQPAAVAIADGRQESGWPAAKAYSYIQTPRLVDAFMPLVGSLLACPPNPPVPSLSRPAQGLVTTVLSSVLVPFQLELDRAVKKWTEAEEAGGVVGVSRDENDQLLSPMSLIDQSRLKRDCLPLIVKV